MKAKNAVSRFITVMTLGLIASVFQNCGLATFNSQVLESTQSSLASANPSKTACANISPAGTTLVRRLNKQELNNSLVDLLGVTGDFTSKMPADPTDTSGFTNNAEALSVSGDYLYVLMDATNLAIVNALNIKDSPFLKCPTIQNFDCAKNQITVFAKKAFRRPVTAAEITKLMETFSVSQTKGLNYSDSISLTMQRVLTSPFFLYRSSFSGGDTAIGKRLSAHEVASRLSYFLWNSTPDDELLKAADSNNLTSESDLRNQVVRLLKDPRADRFIKNFSTEWLGLQKLQAASREGLTNSLKADMIEETQRFTSSLIREDHSAIEFLSSRTSYINENLAVLYGVPGISGNTFQKVDFSEFNIPRRGLLTQGSLLTLTSSPDQTKPTSRGNQILNSITCNPPPPFPDGLTVTPFDGNGEGLTLNERMAMHRRSPTCFACHKEMDPIGLSFENYDQLGRYRTSYSSGARIDTSGEFRGIQVTGASNLIDVILSQDDFKTCLSKKLMTYAIGRTMTTQDQCSAQAIGQTMVLKNRKFSDLVLAIVLSDQFLFNQTDSQGE